MNIHHSSFIHVMNDGCMVVENQRSALSSGDAVQEAVDMKRELLAKIETLGNKLPPNTLDELIDQLGGPENVAEVSRFDQSPQDHTQILVSFNDCYMSLVQMTGRKGRVVSTDDGSVQYESRSEQDAPLEILNLTEKQRFMDGEKVGLGVACVSLVISR